MIPVNEPSLGAREQEYVLECVRTGWVSSAGKFINEFEERWAAYCGRRYGITVSNGTVALQLAVACSGLEPGDEVIMPTFTIISCALAVIYNGVDGERFNPGRRPELGPGLRAELGIDPDVPVCAAIGSGFVRKGFDLLLALWQRAPAPGAVLVLVGGDERLAAWRRQVAEGTLMVLNDGRIIKQKHFKPQRNFEERPLPAVRAPSEGQFCLERLATLVAAA